MHIPEVDYWIEEAGKIGGLAAEFEALQGVIAAQTLRYQWIGEGDISKLYPWYLKHLLRLYNTAQNLAPRGDWESMTYHLQPDTPYDYVPLIMRMRAILVTLPEVSQTEEEEFEVMPLPPKDSTQ